MEFISAAAWKAIYARMVNDKNRTIFPIIGGEPLRGEAALKETARLLRPLLKRKQQP